MSIVYVFASREDIDALLTAPPSDQQAVIDAPGLRVAISCHTSAADAQTCMERQRQILAAAFATPDGSA